MVQAAQYYPRLISTLNTGLRFLPAFTKMKSAMNSGYVGSTTFCDVRINMGSLVGKSYSWLCDDNMGGGCLNIFGAQIVDLLFYLTGQTAVRVHGTVRTFKNQTENIKGIRQISSDDACSFQMEMNAGTFVSVTINAHTSGFQQEVLVSGNQGYLVARNGDLFGKKPSAAKEEPLHIDPNSSILPAVDEEPLLPRIYLEGLVNMFRLLATRLGGGCENGHDEDGLGVLSTFEDAQYVQAVIEAVRNSSRDKCWSKVMMRCEDDLERPLPSPSFFSCSLSQQQLQSALFPPR